MPIQFEIDQRRRLKTVAFLEHVTNEEYVEYCELLNPELMTQYDFVFVDLSQMIDCEFGYDSVWPHAKMASKRECGNSKFVEIIWAPTNIAFGISRIYQSLVDEHIEVKLFRDQDEARQTLDELLDRSITSEQKGRFFDKL